MSSFHPNPMISKELARKLFPLAICIFLLISCIIPGGYCYLEFRKLEKEAGSYASQLAVSIRGLAASAPALWKYQSTKYVQILDTFIPHKGILSICVLDEQSNPIRHFSYDVNSASPFKHFEIEGEPAPVFFNNAKIGEIQISIEADRLVFTTLIVSIVCLITGAALSLLVYRMPLRVVTRLESRLLHYQNSLEEIVAQRTSELQKTTENALMLAEARQRDQEALIEAKTTLEDRVRERTSELQKEVAAKEQALTDLAAAQSSLVEVSRAAGMAEVATGVIHNVGNILNSINVSCILLIDEIRRSRVRNVSKIAAMLTNPEGGLVHFLTEDSRGKQIPIYLESLAAALLEEQQVMYTEAESLRSRIEHIKEIVTMQQNIGRVSGVKEITSPEHLMEDALKLNAGTLALHSVTVHRQYEPTPPISVDRHKVLQILLNLINNAKYACEGNSGEKIITLRIFNHGSDRVRMQVIDNGMGIHADNLTRIFQHGFTTRKDGHGFGLHSGALAARELGGSLTVHSDGPGTGATFTLELPNHSGETL